MSEKCETVFGILGFWFFFLVSLCFRSPAISHIMPPLLFLPDVRLVVLQKRECSGVQRVFCRFKDSDQDLRTFRTFSFHFAHPPPSFLFVNCSFLLSKDPNCSHRPNSTAAFCRALVGAKCCQIGVNQRLWLVDSSGLCQATLHRLKRSAFRQKFHQTSLC